MHGPDIQHWTKALLWLVDFAQLDLSTISAGRRHDLELEYMCFTAYGHLNPSEALKPLVQCTKALQKSKESDELDQFAGSTALVQWTKSVQQSNESADLLTKSQNALHRYLLRPLIDPDEGSSSLLVKAAVRYWVQLGRVIETIETHRDPHEAFLYRAGRLLVECGAFVRRCADCPRLFFATRPKQRFCSARCLGRVTQRRFKTKGKKSKSAKRKT